MDEDKYNDDSDLDFDDDFDDDGEDDGGPSLMEFYGIKPTPVTPSASKGDTDGLSDEEAEAGAREDSLSLSFSSVSSAKAPSTSKPSAFDITDLNSKHFDATRFIQKELQSKSMQELIQTDHEMDSDRSHLDSDMQRLVYENYNKFISATDMIRKMKNNVESMEEEMNKLLANMESISTNCETLESNLNPNRDNVEKLVGVSRLIKRLEFIFELPQRLTQSIELGAHGQAVRYFTKANRILKQYNHMASFEQIRIESERIIRGLKQTLRVAVRDAKSNPLKQLEDSALLIHLGESPEHLLADIFTARRTRLKQELREASDYIKSKDARLEQLKEEEGSLRQQRLALEAEALAVTERDVEEVDDDSDEEDISALSARAQARKIRERQQRKKDKRAKEAEALQARAKALAVEEKQRQDKQQEVVNENSLIQVLEKRFLMSFEIFAKSFKDTFIAPYEADPSDKTQQTVLRCREALTEFTNAIFDEYFALARKELLQRATIEPSMMSTQGLPMTKEAIAKYLSLQTAATTTPDEPKTEDETKESPPTQSGSQREELFGARPGSDAADEPTSPDSVPTTDDAKHSPSHDANADEEEDPNRDELFGPRKPKPKPTEPVEEKKTAPLKPDAKPQLPVQEFIQTLQSFCQGIETPSDLVPGAKLKQQAGEIISHCLRQCVESVFACTQGYIDDLLLHINTFAKSEVNPSADRAKRKAQRQVDLQNYRKLVKAAPLIRKALNLSVILLVPLKATSFLSSASFSAELHDLMQRHYRDWLQHLVCTMLCGAIPLSKGPVCEPAGPSVLCSKEARDHQQPVLFLLLSLITSQLEIKDSFSLLENEFPSRRVHGVVSYVDEILNTIAELKDVSQALLKQYVDSHARRLIHLIRARHLVVKETAPDGVAPQPSVTRVNALLFKMEQEAHAVFRTSRKASGAHPDLTSPVAVTSMPRRVQGSRDFGFNSREMTLQRDMERLFTKKVQIVTELKPSADSLMCATLKIACKAFDEYVRDLVIDSAAAFQQIEADVYGLRSAISKSVSGEDKVAVEQLLDEVMASASDRSVQAFT